MAELLSPSWLSSFQPLENWCARDSEKWTRRCGLSESEILSRLEQLDDYIGYRAWYLMDSDHMAREDLSQEARKAIVKTLKNGDHYPNSYLRQVASTAMSQYLRRGKSVDKPWNDYERRHGCRIHSLDAPRTDGRDRHEVSLYRQRRLEDVADARIMLDQLESHLDSPQRHVLHLLRQGYSQVHISRALGRPARHIYNTARTIRDKAREIWYVGISER